MGIIPLTRSFPQQSPFLSTEDPVVFLIQALNRMYRRAKDNL